MNGEKKETFKNEFVLKNESITGHSGTSIPFQGMQHFYVHLFFFTSVPNMDENANETAAKEEKPTKKRSRDTGARKSRLQRQISNVQHVLDKYVPGKTLGELLLQLF